MFHFNEISTNFAERESVFYIVGWNCRNKLWKYHLEFLSWKGCPNDDSLPSQCRCLPVHHKIIYFSFFIFQPVRFKLNHASYGRSHLLTWVYKLLSEVNLNWLCSSDAIWQQRSGSTLVHVMAVCLKAPSHYMWQCAMVLNMQDECQLLSSARKVLNYPHHPSVGKW